LVDKPENILNQVTWDYAYDWLNRLTNVSKGGVLQSVYVYDESDNRKELQLPLLGLTHTYSYDQADQIVSRSLNGVSAETFTHDADGNMLTRTDAAVTTTYRWNAMDKLVGISKPPTQSIAYKYDSGGIRKQKDADTKFYSTSMSLNDTKPSGDLAYIQGHQLLGLIQGGNCYWFLPDGLGSIRVVVDSAGATVATYSSDEFGKQESASGSSDMLGHTYTGALGVRNDWDASGLLYMQQRYYDPQLGRWLSLDPIGFAGGLNQYTYVGNSPVNFVDPVGLIGEPALQMASQVARHTNLVVGGPASAFFVLAAGAHRQTMDNHPGNTYPIPSPGPSPSPDCPDEKQKKRPDLYHYTTAEGLEGILGTRSIRPSLDPKFSRYGQGQYFTDIPPEAVGTTLSVGQVLRRLFGQPWGLRTRLTNYVQVDTRDLPVVNPVPHIYVHPSTQPLDVTNRIIRSGRTPGL
jgi:RHS repeat-associated protein